MRLIGDARHFDDADKFGFRAEPAQPVSLGNRVVHSDDCNH